MGNRYTLKQKFLLRQQERLGLKVRARYFFYDFGWGAGKEEICKATVKGTFNISGGVASVVMVEGTYNILDDRCSARWNSDLKLESAVICQIGFDLYCDDGWSSVTQSAYVDGEDGCYVLIHI